MGNCLNVSTRDQPNIQQSYPVNPYGVQPVSQQPQSPYPQIHPYFGDTLDSQQVKKQKNTYLNQQLSQNNKVIATLTQKILLQNMKLQQQQNALKLKNMKNQEEKEKNKYQGCYSYGKNNILKWQGICGHCKIKRMERFLDYSNIKNMCKCQGFGVVQGSKINKKCSQWFCGQKIKPFLICQKCYGYGFKFYEKSFFSF